MDDRIEPYTYPSFCRRDLARRRSRGGRSAWTPHCGYRFVLAGLIALVHARMGQLNRGDALAAGIGAFVVAAFAAVSDLIENL